MLVTAYLAAAGEIRLNVSRNFSINSDPIKFTNRFEIDATVVLNLPSELGFIIDPRD